ncbi:MAG: DinB family protein [Bacteroidota bacterium]|nr:DinB family protein [Bacteroidota bacterium]
MAEQEMIFVKMALNNWNEQLTRAGKLIDSLSDAELEQHVAPDRNTGKYLLGHLTAVHDGLFPMLGLGGKLYPELEQPFIANPESAKLPGPDLQQLRTCWTKVNQTLSAGFNAMTPEDWFGRHNSVSAEDFKKEPHRNKLNVLLSRTAHLSYHRGQLIFLQKK